MSNLIFPQAPSRLGRRYGYIPDDHAKDKQDQVCKIAFARATAFPDEFRDNMQFMPPVWDQGQVGRCTGESHTAQIMGLRNKLGFDDLNSQEQLSVDFAYFNARRLEGSQGEDAGAQIRDMQSGTLKYGICTDLLHPTNDSSVLLAPSDASYQDGLLRQNIKAMRVPQSELGFKSVLYQGYTINLGFTVYSSFESDAVAKTGIMPIPNSFTEQVLGGHAVLVIGWCLLQGHLYLIVRNSWSDKWGDKGYFYMPIAFALNPRFVNDIWTVTECEHNGEFTGDNSAVA